MSKGAQSPRYPRRFVDFFQQQSSLSGRLNEIGLLVAVVRELHLLQQTLFERSERVGIVAQTVRSVPRTHEAQTLGFVQLEIAGPFHGRRRTSCMFDISLDGIVRHASAI